MSLAEHQYEASLQQKLVRFATACTDANSIDEKLILKEFQFTVWRECHRCLFNGG